MIEKGVTMNIRNNIINDIQSFSPELLSQVFHYFETLKNKKKDSEQYNWKKFIRCIGDDEAKIIKNIIDEEFNNIEGEW